MKLSKCNVCGSEKITVALKTPGREYLRCKNCGLTFKSILPPANQIAEYFAELPSQEDKEDVWLGSKTHLFNRGLGIIERNVTEKGYLLDIGCGHGYFLKMAKDSGWKEVEGIELSKKATEFAQNTYGIRVHDKPVRELNLPSGHYDCVAMWGALEYLQDPAADLREIYRLLKPGGFLFIRFHNVNFHVFVEKLSPILEKAGLYPSVLHNFGFNANSLKTLLTLVRFEKIKILNSPATSGDPYKTSRFLGRWFVALSKMFMYASAETVRFLTHGRILLAPSLIASASKPSVCRPPGKKRIMQIITRLDRGGSSENLLLVCERINRDKFETIVVHGYSGDMPPDGILPEKTFCINELVRGISPVKDIGAFWKILALIRVEKPDIVHTHSSKAGILGRWAGCLAGTKLIHSPHGHVFYGYFGGLKTAFFILIERLTARLTHRLIALTDGEKNESTGFGVGKAGQWEIIPAGILYPDESKIKAYRDDAGRIRAKLKIPEEAIVIGTIARLAPVKGIKYFVKAAKIIKEKMQVNRQKVVFLIVGDGEERPALEGGVKRQDMENDFILPGMQDDIFPFLAIMDIYVQPSKNEGMGKTLLFAQMFSKPIIATQVQGIPDIVQDGKTGLLVPPADADGIASAVITLIEKPHLAKILGENAKRKINKMADGLPEFGIERTVYLLERIYENI